MKEIPSSDSLFINSWKLPLIILVLAAFFRLWGTFELNEHLEDEVLHVSDSISVGTYGTTANWGWHHPQLRSLIVYATIALFGDNPAGWRSSNVFFGTASVAVLFLIGRLIYPGSAAWLIAGSLLAFDPHHIYLSRTTYVEIPVTFFFLLYLYLLLEYTERNLKTLPLAGIAMGLTIATKAYFVFAIPMAVLYAGYSLRKQGQLTRPVVIDLTVSLLFLPCAVCLLSYYPWFGRGHTLPEFVQMKMDAVWALQRNTNFINQAFLDAGGKPWEWFTKPLFWGHQRLTDSEEGRFLLQTNNPPFRLLVLPSLAAASIYAWKNSIHRELLPLLLFASCYLLILSAQRPMFSYSSAVLLPFAYLALARAITMTADKFTHKNSVYMGFLVAMFIWCAYFFPLLSARLVPLSPFRPILSMVRYMGNF